MNPNNDSNPSFEDILTKFGDLVASKRGKPLIEAEEIIIRGTFNDESYLEMAEKSDYKVNYLQRTLASRFFGQLTRTFGTEINKNNLVIMIEKLVANDTGENSYSKYLNKVRGGLPPDISNFYGRVNEIEKVKNLIDGNNCICLVGVAGIGKSALAAKVMADISLEKKAKFDCFVWKPVSHKPPLKDLVTELLAIIDPVHNFSGLPENINSRISVLVKLLQKKSCLVVLDDFSANTDETVYQSFLRRLVEEQHNSCFVLASRTIEDIVEELIQAKRSIDSFKLEGLDESTAMQLLSQYGLKDENKCHELIKKYRGNPSELEAVALKISKFFGNEKTFFQNPTTLVSNKMASMLDEMFAKTLTNLQTQVLFYIAEIDDESSISLSKLLKGIKKKIQISNSEIISVLEKLEQYSLLEKRQSATKEMTFAIQPAIKKYIKTNLLAVS